MIASSMRGLSPRLIKLQLFGTNLTMHKNLFIPLAIMAILQMHITHVKGQDTLIYLFPGQGSDERLFKHLVVPPGFDTIHISYPVPEKREDLQTYAFRFIPRIDTTAPFILAGVSLGGMICTELADTLSPVRTILISSSKTCGELPGRYTFQKKIPLNRLIPKGLIKAGARLLQGVVEPDRKHDKETFKSMLKEKDPLYLKRTVDMIIQWDRTTHSDRIIHLHGNKDHTIPVKNVKVDYLVEGGSHMMMLTRADEINALLGPILRNHWQ
jgi:pimeloyl-ACP methyl ester carboxylesterase